MVFICGVFYWLNAWLDAFKTQLTFFFKFVLSLHTSAPVAALVPEMIDVAWDLKALKVLRRVKGFLIVWGCLEVKSWCGSFMPQWSDFGGTQNSKKLIFVLHWLYHYHYTFQALGQILHLCQSWWKRQNDYQDQVSTAFRDLKFYHLLHKNSRHKAVSQLKSFSNIQIHLPYQHSTCCQQSEWVERTVEKLMTRKKISHGSFSNC